MSESVDPIKFEVIRNTLTAATEEMAAAYLGEVLSESNIISFDMGGTTAKVGLILDGKPMLTKEYEVGAAERATDLKHDYAVTMIRPAVCIDIDEVEARFQSLAREGGQSLQREGIGDCEMVF